LAVSRYGLQLAHEELAADGVEPCQYGALSFIGVMQPVTRTELHAGDRRSVHNRPRSHQEHEEVVWRLRVALRDLVGETRDARPQPERR
jgi:hypothetical protein